ncbi:hypothetical protein AV926_02800 [Myroides marinus]|uniref:Uncharacterized protein n=1 Tax=Myroides marinus TaxID=703342 RepID=A0A161SD04_9FLAO|nr:hypothetical protein [Myroides marinus]KZE84071.1 hypothetical protein AV926_02800 [Myroides marinus]
MELRLYPKFEEVFSDDTLEGIFYPLCTAVLPSGKQVHFVSHNGVWTADESNSDQNTSDYYRFKLIDNKYTFSGDISIYQGYELVGQIHKILEVDFKTNEDHYFKAKLALDEYTDRVKALLPEIDADFDLDTYIEFFYAYSLNKLVYQRTGQFAKYRQLIDGFAKADPSPYVYSQTDADFDVALYQGDFDSLLDLMNYTPIGMTIGCEFFTDGNDCVLYYNESDDTVICFNAYS